MYQKKFKLKQYNTNEQINLICLWKTKKKKNVQSKEVIICCVYLFKFLS